MPRPFRIGIVGIGPTGGSVLLELLRRFGEQPPQRRVELTLIDPSEKFGYGYAFQSDHVLNMRADTMSMISEHTTDFTDWIKRNTALCSYHGVEYPPRKVFGAYLNDIITKTVSRDYSGLAIDHWRTLAVGLSRSAGEYIVEGRDGQARAFSVLVLAVGESRYSAYCRYIGQAGFVPSPWESDCIAGLPSGASVGILGTSLSAVDACVQLLRQNHAGDITCFARTRGFPKVQGEYEEYRPVFMTDQWASTLANYPSKLPLGALALMFKLELETCMQAPYQPGRPDPREWFSVSGYLIRREHDEGDVFLESVQISRHDRTPWYYALDSVAHLTPYLWHRLAEHDQHRFLESFYSAWCEYRHSMPLVNAAVLAPAVAGGQLAIRPGLVSVESGAGSKPARWHIVVKQAGRGESTRYSVDFLIDATGGWPDLACRRSRLLSSALRKGILHRDLCGGVKVEFGSCRAENICGELWDDLYVIGPVTFGTHFYTNSFETNRDLAFTVAAKIERLLRKEPEKVPGVL